MIVIVVVFDEADTGNILTSSKEFIKLVFPQFVRPWTKIVDSKYLSPFS